MGERTPLYELHRQAGARFVEFGGWDMPVNYGSQIDEHHCVRRDAGMFDVSHMTRIDLHGAGARPYLRHLVANNVDKLSEPGKALYTCMLRPDGGVIDDLIIYYLREDWFRIVVNAATRDKDLAWMREQLTADVDLKLRPDLAMIAAQGPQAISKAIQALGASLQAAVADLKIFYAAETDDGIFVARTGYTGEDGLELIMVNDRAPAIWSALAQAGIRPCGLGARDTLRLEAGMNLYGSDMDESTTPLESGLGWTVGWEPAEREFIGRGALEQQREHGLQRKLVGVVLNGRGVLRGHQKIVTDHGQGEVTSGTFSPTLERSIGLARVPAACCIDEICQVDIRGKLLEAKIVKYPFVRNGKSCL